MGMPPSDIKLTAPWNNVADKDLPSFESHPDFPGEFLNYYKLPIGVYVKIPQPFPPQKYED